MQTGLRRQDTAASRSLTVASNGCRHRPLPTAPEGPPETPCKQMPKWEQVRGGGAGRAGAWGRRWASRATG